MKHQYFGDINDYRKYRLLRSIIRVSDLKLLVAWMLTPDDESTDGRKLSYLDKPEKWSGYDPELFSTLLDLVLTNKSRSVHAIEYTNLFSRTAFFSEQVPANADDRNKWFGKLLEKGQHADLVFLDPDIGIEVPSVPYGTKRSPMYLYWKEVEVLWKLGKSLLIFQHFTREKRDLYIDRITNDLRKHTQGSTITAFKTANVLFFLAHQSKHRDVHNKLMNFDIV